VNIDYSNSTNDEIEKFYKKISKKVKDIREKKGFTQQQVALEIGIKSLAFYSNCENNKNEKHFNLEHLYKMAKMFELDVVEFLK